MHSGLRPVWSAAPRLATVDAADIRGLDLAQTVVRRGAASPVGTDVPMVTDGPNRHRYAGGAGASRAIAQMNPVSSRAIAVASVTLLVGKSICRPIRGTP